MADIYTGTYHAKKELKAIQAHGDSIPPLYPNKSSNSPPLTQITINDNSLTHKSNNFKPRQPSQVRPGEVN